MFFQLKAKSKKLVAGAPGKQPALVAAAAPSKARPVSASAHSNLKARQKRQKASTGLALVYGALLGTTGLLLAVPELRQAACDFKSSIAGQVQLFFRTPGLDVPIVSDQVPKNPNDLAIGSNAKSNKTQKLKFNEPIELDSLTKKEIIALRTMYVSQHKDLLHNPYQPYKRIYRDIQDGLPWIGLRGMTCQNEAHKRMYGLSLESISLNNPYLLVEAEFQKCPSFDYLVGNPDNITDFPYYCKPQNLTWNAKSARMDVTYNLTDFAKRVQKANNGAPIGVGVSTSEFDVTCIKAINAYDMGYTHIAANMIDQSGQVTMIYPAVGKVNEVWHRGELCGPSNNLGRYSSLQCFKAVPGSSVKVRLWKKEPTTPAQPGDMEAFIHIL